MKPCRNQSAKRGSHLEVGFANLFRSQARQQPQPVAQFAFAKESMQRQWRFDFAWPEHKLAVEIEGGIFVQGGHNRPVQFTKDCEKHNAAVMLGWRLLRYSTLDLRTRPVQVIEQVVEALQQQSPATPPVRQQSMIPDDDF